MSIWLLLFMFVAKLAVAQSSAIVLFPKNQYDELYGRRNGFGLNPQGVYYNQNQGYYPNQQYYNQQQYPSYYNNQPYGATYQYGGYQDPYQQAILRGVVNQELAATNYGYGNLPYYGGGRTYYYGGGCGYGRPCLKSGKEGAEIVEDQK